MAEVKWIKVSTDMFNNNRKITQIEHMPEGDTMLVIWLKLLLLAGNINDGGAIYLTPEIPYTEEMLSTELDRPLTTVKMALKVFEQFGMIEIIDNVYYLSSWEKYQNTDKLAEIREQNRKRVAKCREKKLLSQGNVTGNVTVTLGNAIEEEKEEDKEKEYHSFIHSIASEEEAFIQKRIEEAGFEGRDAEVYREELEDSLRLKYMTGTLGQGVVLMSDEQFGDLCDKLTYDEINKYMGIIVECEKNGKRYKKKSHYQAILDMAAKDRRISK